MKVVCKKIGDKSHKKLKKIKFSIKNRGLLK